jgi:membrane-bound lytic murein transglycosylase D
MPTTARPSIRRHELRRAISRFSTDRYGDWLLALAAYNAGEGRVDRALARHPGATYWDLVDALALPPISREYVPKILAVVQVTANPDACDATLAAAPLH